MRGLIPALCLIGAGGVIWAAGLVLGPGNDPDPSLAGSTAQQIAPVAASAPDFSALYEDVWQPGDIVFRGKPGGWGNLGAQLSDRDQRFGHVGVIVGGQDGLEVIDAAGHPMAQNAVVTRGSLASFFKGATQAGVYRPELTSAQRRTFLSVLEDHALQATPFDSDFSLEGDDALYCSELVWRALYEATGTDPVIDYTDWMGARVIAIDDLQFAPLLVEVAPPD